VRRVASRLTADQVIGLAPDSASVAAARKLATPAPWTGQGSSESAIWGLAKGSGANPYRVAVDLSGPAYSCSCPSRKIPCKHALGLLLLWSASDLPAGEPPGWAAEWLRHRGEHAEAAQARREQRASKEADPEARAARTAKRAATISAGLEDLDRFLADLVREGFATARERPWPWWDAQARRLVDSQAPALAERVRRLGSVLHAGRPDWPVRALAEAAALHLIVRAWQRGDEVPADLRDDLRTHVGWAFATDDVRQAAPPERGPWAVIGVRIELQDQLRVRRTWLRRPADGRVALLLDFAAGAAPFSFQCVLGTMIEGALYTYPGRAALRMAVDGELRIVGEWDGPAIGDDVDAALTQWGRAVAADPFVSRIAVALHDVVPVNSRDRWWVRQVDGTSLPLAAEDDIWPLVSLAGGRPVGLAGEWDGETLRILSASADGRTWSLQ
jgi:hypothetical protein